MSVTYKDIEPKLLTDWEVDEFDKFSGDLVLFNPYEDKRMEVTLESEEDIQKLLELQN